MSASAVTEKGSASSSALLNQPIVLDVGTASIKAGFAGGGKPKVCILTIVIILYFNDARINVLR
jgi:hypothetical protein